LLIKAVSDKLFSSDIFCITLSDKDSEKITPAGLPSNTLFENEST
jgi:hypothetical protein